MAGCIIYIFEKGRPAPRLQYKRIYIQEVLFFSFFIIGFLEKYYFCVFTYFVGVLCHRWGSNSHTTQMDGERELMVPECMQDKLCFFLCGVDLCARVSG